MPKNSTGIVDEDLDHSDWVELYNSGTETVNLGGYAITDEATDLQKWIFPPVSIAAGEFALVFCSGKDRLGAELHTNFKLSASDEVYLSDLSGTVIDSVEIDTKEHDISEGFVVDGSGEIKAFYEATPGSSNLDGILHNEITLSREAGFYVQTFELNATGSESNDIRYTLDGSIPTESDPIFPPFLSIENRTLEPMNLASIPTTAPNLDDDILWEQPSGNPYRGTVVRLRSFSGSQPTSHVKSVSYFVNPLGATKYTLPVVSIITDSLNLFDYDTGLFVPGLHHDLDPNGGWVWGTGNYHQAGDEWERAAHFELFDANGELEHRQDLGIRVHGTGSRAYPQKSIRLYAREKYGESKIEEKIFDNSEKDEFDVLVLRNFGQDFVTGVAQDVLANRIIKGTNQAYLEDKAVVTFINGEYWGIQNLRERFDKHFLADYHDLHKDSIDIIDSYYGDVNFGDDDAFDELYDFMTDNSLESQTNYDWAASKMDIDDFIDNTLARFFMGCYDWPGNNMRMWRPHSEEGKFKWLLLDNDRCLGNASFNSLEHATDPDNTGWPNPYQSTLFLRRLLENNGFKQQFIARMAELLNTNFNRVSVATKITDLYNQYRPEYAEHDARWNAINPNETLQENYQRIVDVVRVRGCYIKSHFVDYFNLSEAEFPYECDSTQMTLGIEDEFATGNFLVFPNPNNGTFTAVLPEFTQTSRMELIDVQGRIVESRTLDRTERVFEYSESGLRAGVYVLRFTSENEVLTQRIVIQ